MSKEYIKSPLNYTGGKHRLLPQLMPLFPQKIGTFVDLFCGGGNVGVNINADKIIYNDSNDKLIGLLKTLGKYKPEKTISKIEELINRYNLSDSYNNGYSFYECKSGKGLSDYNKMGYLRLRNDFNQLKRRDSNYYYYLFTLIIFAFNNQIRFNGKGQYNLPVGKRDFNSNIRRNLIDFVTSLNNQNAEYVSKSFVRFDMSLLDENDFVYCDPPYLITTASYNEMGGWTDKDEEALLLFLDKLNENQIRFALSNVTKHKGKENRLLIEWAKKYTVHYLAFNYNNSSYHGKDTERETQEVLITNY